MSEDAAEYNVKDGGKAPCFAALAAGQGDDDARRTRAEALKLGARATVWAEEMLRHATEGDWPRFEWAAGEVVSTGRKAQRLVARLRAVGSGQSAPLRQGYAGQAVGSVEGGQA